MKGLALALLLLLGNPGPGDPEPALRLRPPQWDFGTVRKSPAAAAPVLEQTVTIESSVDRPVRVTLLSTCACLSVEPARLQLPPRGKGAFRLRYDPAEDSGEVLKDLMLRTDLEGLQKALYTVRGRVEGAADGAGETADGFAEGAADGAGETADGFAAGAGSTAGSAGGPPGPAGAVSTRAGAEPLRLQFYHSPGCAECRRFLERTLPAAERRAGIAVQVEALNILDPAVYDRYRETLASLGEKERAYPALVVDRTVLQGSREIDRRLPEVLRRAVSAQGGTGALKTAAPKTAPANRQSGEARPAGSTPLEELSGRLAFLPVLAAGLLDGINPCAFTTLIFLLAALGLAGRSRRQVLLIGGCFSLAVLVTYFLIGLGLFQALRLAGSFPWIARLLRLLLIAALGVLAALSLYDFFQIRAGRAGRILLQLPGALKRRIHSSIRARVGSIALVSTSLVLGFLVSVFELACTGQVYFPMLAYLAQARRQAAALFYLVLYNLGFITPLLAVFGLAYAGIGSRDFTAFLQRSMAPVKLALAALFIGLAFLTALSY